MKRIWFCLTAALLCLTLTACSRLVPEEYTQVSVHSDTQKAQEDPDALTAENISGLKRAIRSFVSNHIEHGVIRVYNYTGSVEDDLSSAAYEVSREDPLGAYAVDYMTHDCSLIVSFYEIHIDITFRKTLQQIDEIEYVGSDTEAKKLISAAMHRDEGHLQRPGGGQREALGDGEGRKRLLLSHRAGRRPRKHALPSGSCAGRREGRVLRARGKRSGHAPGL